MMPRTSSKSSKSQHPNAKGEKRKRDGETERLPPPAKNRSWDPGRKGQGGEGLSDGYGGSAGDGTGPSGPGDKRARRLSPRGAVRAAIISPDVVAEGREYGLICPSLIGHSRCHERSERTRKRETQDRLQHCLIGGLLAALNRALGARRAHHT